MNNPIIQQTRDFWKSQVVLILHCYYLLENRCHISIMIRATEPNTWHELKKVTVDQNGLPSPPKALFFNKQK